MGGEFAFMHGPCLNSLSFIYSCWSAQLASFFFSRKILGPIIFFGGAAIDMVDVHTFVFFSIITCIVIVVEIYLSFQSA